MFYFCSLILSGDKDEAPTKMAALHLACSAERSLIGCSRFQRGRTSTWRGRGLKHVRNHLTRSSLWFRTFRTHRILQHLRPRSDHSQHALLLQQLSAALCCPQQGGVSCWGFYFEKRQGPAARLFPVCSLTVAMVTQLRVVVATDKARFCPDK